MIDIDARIAEDDAALAAARAQDEHAAAEAKFAPAPGAEAAPKASGALAKADQFNADVERWTQRLPRNIGLGLLDAAVNTWDAMKEIGVAAGKGADMRDAMDSGAAPVAPTAAQNRVDSAAIDKASEDGETMAAVRAFRNHAAQGDTMSDQLTQGTAQFAIPFMGFSKALGGFKAVSKGVQVARAVGAEAATSATAFDPHAGRLADLYALGQHTEGKLADVLNTLAPDGSALNEYINYMSDRGNEGVAEGRFKNVVDNLVGSAAVAGLLKTGAKSFRVARALPEYLDRFNPDAPIAPVGSDLIVYHGTPHDFDVFDNAKIGSGEGHQSFGHGLYFAENPAIAGNYEAKLSKDAPGKVVEVDIPDEKVVQMLDHDADMGKQQHVLDKIPESDRAQLEQMLVDHNRDGDLRDFTGNQFYQLIKRAINEDYLPFNPADGNFDNSAKIASEYLASKGVPGIRYLDSSSRKAGEGTRNIVLFNGKDATITKKNGTPVPNPKQYVPATAQEMGDTAKNALIDLQDVVDPTNLTPKQQAAYAGLQQSIKQGVDQGWPVSQIVAKARREAQTFLPTGTPPSLPFRKLVDDLVTHGEQGVSQPKPIAPVRVEETPDGHTVIVGEQPLVTFTKPEDAAAAVADMQQQFGAGFEARHEANRATLTDNHFDTLHTFSRMLERAVDKPVKTQSLVTALESQLKGDTEQGAFYKDLLGRIAAKKIGGVTTIKSTPGRHPTSVGFFTHADNSIELYPQAFKVGGPEKLLHSFAHEAVHAATYREMFESPQVFRKIGGLLARVQKALPEVKGNDAYGFTNAYEFVAEAESNPKFRTFLKSAKSDNGENFWETYKTAIGKILGLSSAAIAAPEFEKLLNPKQEEEQPGA